MIKHLQRFAGMKSRASCSTIEQTDQSSHAVHALNDQFGSTALLFESYTFYCHSSFSQSPLSFYIYIYPFLHSDFFCPVPPSLPIASFFSRWIVAHARPVCPAPANSCIAQRKSNETTVRRTRNCLWFERLPGWDVRSPTSYLYYLSRTKYRRSVLRINVVGI